MVQIKKQTKQQQQQNTPKIPPPKHRNKTKATLKLIMLLFIVFEITPFQQVPVFLRCWSIPLCFDFRLRNPVNAMAGRTPTRRPRPPGQSCSTRLSASLNPAAAAAMRWVSFCLSPAIHVLIPRSLHSCEARVNMPCQDLEMGVTTGRKCRST